MFDTNEIALIDLVRQSIFRGGDLLVCWNHREDIKNCFLDHMRGLQYIEANGSFHDTREVNFFFIL